MSEMVMWFYGIILLTVKRQASQRYIDWQIRFFNRMVERLDQYSGAYPYAIKMADELSLCKRRRSPRWMYNISNIDEVCAQYQIHKSPAVLNQAWELFCSGAYRIGG